MKEIVATYPNLTITVVYRDVIRVYIILACVFSVQHMRHLLTANIDLRLRFFWTIHLTTFFLPPSISMIT